MRQDRKARVAQLHSELAMSLRLFAVSAALLASEAPALAAEDDANLWLGQFATINANDKVYVRLETQERFTNDAERLGQLLLRSLVTYRLHDKANAGSRISASRSSPP